MFAKTKKMVETIEDIKFDIIKVLKVIETDTDLNEIFRGDTITIPYNILYTLAKQNSLTPEIIERANGVFEHIILKNEKPRIAYLKLSVDSVEPVSEKSFKPHKLPKHYGKKRILEDIKVNNQTSELDRAMLALNGYRNMYSKLKNRCINDKLKGTNRLSDSDCRDIVAVLKLIENKLLNILKK